MPALTETIAQEFMENGVQINQVYAGRVQDLAEMYNFTAEEMIDEWLAFSMGINIDMTPNSEENMDLFSKAVKKSHDKKMRRKVKKMKKEEVNPYPQQGNQNNAILNAYLSTPNMKLSSVEMENIKSMTSAIKNSPLQVTKSPFSPVQSPMYKLRTNSGEVAFSLVHEGEEGGGKVQWNKSLNDKRYKAKLTNSTKQKPSYMFMKHVDISNLNNDQVEMASEELRNQHEDEIEDYHPCNDPSQSQVTIVGRLTSEDEQSKLTQDTLVLEGCRTVSNGRRVKVDVSKLQGGSLFRGQICAFTGKNPSGMRFLAEKAHTLKTPDGNVRVGKCDDVTNDVCSVMVACGPFTTSDAMSYEPLLDFIKKVKQSKPDMTLIIGPLLDEDHQQVRTGQMDESLMKCSKKWLEFLKKEMSSYTQVIFVPSQKDAFHVPIYPQPAYQPPNNPQDPAALFCPDPCTVSIGDSPVKIGVTSVDVLMHMGSNEISCKQFGGGGPDRRCRLMSHLIDNTSYYPLYPPPPTFNCDVIKAEAMCRMTSCDSDGMTSQCVPDVLIVPSDLRPFCKIHNGRLFLNPGRLSKGNSGGNYGHFLLGMGNPLNGVSCVAKIVKI